METADHVILIVKPILEGVPEAVLEVSKFGRQGPGAIPLFWIKATRVQACARAIREQAGFSQLENFSAMQVEDDMIFSYFARNPESRERVLLRASVETKSDKWIDLESVSAIWPMALSFENEISKFFGVRFSGCEAKTDWGGFPLRKSFVPSNLAGELATGAGSGGMEL